MQASRPSGHELYSAGWEARGQAEASSELRAGLSIPRQTSALGSHCRVKSRGGAGARLRAALRKHRSVPEPVLPWNINKQAQPRHQSLSLIGPFRFPSPVLIHQLPLQPVQNRALFLRSVLPRRTEGTGITSKRDCRWPHSLANRTCSAHQRRPLPKRGSRQNKSS